MDPSGERSVRRGRAISGWVVVLALASVGSAAAIDYAHDVERFRQQADGILVRPQNVMGEDGRVALWSLGYLLSAEVALYEATGNRAYLVEFIRAADWALGQRDGERGLQDYRGLSLPAWQASFGYTLRQCTLVDGGGHATLLIRSLEALRPLSGRLSLEVQRRGDGEFDLAVQHSDGDEEVREIFERLTVDPAAATAGGPTYVEAAVNGSSAFVTVHDLHEWGGSRRPPRAGIAAVEPAGYIFACHTGHVAYPLARFARLVGEHDALGRDPLWADAAGRYLDAAVRAVAVHDDEWSDRANAEGVYVVRRRAPVWYEGLELPHNQSLSLGRAVVELLRVTGSAEYRDKVARLARTFKDDLTHVSEADAYVWPYWWSRSWGYRGWAEQDAAPNLSPTHRGTAKMEDVAHAGMSVEFAVLCCREGIVFNEQDMARLAHTMTRLVARPQWRMAFRVDGSDRSAREDATVRWLALTPYAPELYPLVRETYIHCAERKGGTRGKYGWAQLARYAAQPSS